MTTLTKRTIDALKPRDKAYIAFDSGVKGFGLRVMPTGVKTYVFEYRPQPGGRHVSKKRLVLGRHGAMTAEQARRAALDALARIRLGHDPQAEKGRHRGSLTVGALVEAFIDGHVSKTCKPRTAEAHMIALERLRSVHGGMKAEALTRGQVAALHLRQASAPYAANRFLAVTSKCYSWAVSRGLLPEGHINPARGIGRYKEHARERFLTGEELARLGDALRGGEARLDPFAIAAVRLLILTGARLHEILDAKWSQVDFERSVIFLADSKTGRKPIYLSAAALVILAGLPRFDGNPHIIPSGNNGASRVDLKRPWRAVTRAAGLGGLRLHDLRHSFASIGACASLGLPIIGKLLGHSQASTTARYAHLGDDPLRRASETIGATIAAAMDKAVPHVVPLVRRG